MSLTCEVVEDPCALSGQGWLSLEVSLKKCTQSNHQTNVSHLSAQVFYRAGGQEVSHTPQQRTDKLEEEEHGKKTMTVKRLYTLDFANFYLNIKKCCLL